MRAELSDRAPPLDPKCSIIGSVPRLSARPPTELEKAEASGLHAFSLSVSFFRPRESFDARGSATRNGAETSLAKTPWRRLFGEVFGRGSVALSAVETRSITGSGSLDL